MRISVWKSSLSITVVAGIIAISAGRDPRLMEVKAATKPAPYTTWSDYFGDADSEQYSALKQINKRNVSQLQQVWFYQAGDNANRYGFTTGYYVFALPKKP
jgi:quinoprotein glucose dehydrogenase